MSDDPEASASAFIEEPKKSKFAMVMTAITKPFTFIFSSAVGAVSSVFLNGIFAFLPTVFSGIVLVLKPIFIVLYYLFSKIIPFLVVYVGVPLFILGAILAFMFLGGHILWVVVFCVGIYFYVKGLYNIKFVKKAEVLETETHSEDTLKYK